MEKKQACFLVQKEKRKLTGRSLFSFLLEKPAPKEVSLCGVTLRVLFAPEFVEDRKRGIFGDMKGKVLHYFLKSKKDRMLAMANKDMPSFAVEACLDNFLKKECAFRKTTRVLIVDKGLFELESLMLPYCVHLNYLELLVEHKENYEYFAERLYEESGLAVAITGWLGSRLEEKFHQDYEAEGIEIEWKESQRLSGVYHIIIDLNRDFLVGKENLAAGCVYFDGFSSREKEHRLRTAGVGATYISPVIYLDRALKSTV